MKFKLFISSRNNARLSVPEGYANTSLSDLRTLIKTRMEEFLFLGKEFFEVRINEHFGADASQAVYAKCLSEVQEADLTIALYNGAAGWAPPGNETGICRDELTAALGISTRKTAVIDISGYFKPEPESDAEVLRDKAFKQYLDDLGIPENPLKRNIRTAGEVEDEVLASVKNIVFQHIEERIKLSNHYYNIQGNNRVSLDWKKLKYHAREEQLTTILRKIVTESPDFSQFTCKVCSVPDNLSVADARSFAGRPFLNDQDSVSGRDVPDGPIHFIGVYGKATELQVKNMVGYPDISAIKGDFGYYVWEQNTHIQLVFLTECGTPDALRSKFTLFSEWCAGSGEHRNIGKRAKARLLIMNAINEAKRVTAS